MLPTTLIDRVLRVAPINPAPDAWTVQTKYGAAFVPERRLLQTQDVIEALTHRKWLASRAIVAPSGEARTDRIAFDIDCKTANDELDRNQRYWTLRALMGEDRVPLVYGTPSGLGLRVVYRIPEVPLAEVATGAGRGLVANVLRGADLRFGRGRVEIFPQAKLVDRVMLGRRMPLLDPQTLSSMGPRPIGDRFDLRALMWALSFVENWFANPERDLLEYLRAQPGATVERVPMRGSANRQGVATMTSGASPEPLIVTRSGKQLDLGPSMYANVCTGLTASSTRYETEFLVAIALIVAPHLFPQYGLTTASDDRTVAQALALWLSWKHNGYSREWRDSERCGGTAAALAYWADRYLRAGVDGRHMIARARCMAWALLPRRRLVVQNSARERAIAHRLAAQSGLSDAPRYKFEVWLNCFIRAVKRIELYHERRGQPLQSRCYGGRRDVLVEIAAEWMERWPYGKGTRGTGYRLYQRLLLEKPELFSRATGYVSPTLVAPGDPAAFRGTATRYWVRTYDARPIAADLPFAPWEIDAAIEGLGARHRRSWTADEIYHALWARDARVPAKDRWGRRTSDLLRKLVRDVVPLAEQAAAFGYPDEEAA